MAATQNCSEIKNCRFCGTRSLKFTVSIPACGIPKVWGECNNCGARTSIFRVVPISNSVTTDNSLSTPITTESILKATKDALSSWNRRENK